MKQGENRARSELNKLKKDTLNYYLDEQEINSLGYALLGNSNPYNLPESHMYSEALTTLKLNVELFPTSWNAYDSYGEISLFLCRVIDLVNGEMWESRFTVLGERKS